MVSVLVACGFTFTAISAEEDDISSGLALGTIEYMDPFDFTITRYVVDPAPVSATPSAIPMPVIVPANIGRETPSMMVIEPGYFLRPLIRVPYKPELRSPCKP